MATSTAQGYVPGRPRQRPALALIAQRNAMDARPCVSRREVDYIAWVKRIVDETTRLPGTLEWMSASSTMLWLRHCDVSSLCALSATCRALRGRASAFGTASLVEVAAALLCRDLYQALRPSLAPDQVVPYGAALLPMTPGTSTLTRPSWLARLRSLRRGARLVVAAYATKTGVAVAVREVRAEGLVELSRRPLGLALETAKPLEVATLPYRGSLLVYHRAHDPLAEATRASLDAPRSEDDEEATACRLKGGTAIRWDPSTARWQVVPLWRNDDIADAVPALASANFRRALCVDDAGRLVVASAEYRRQNGHRRRPGGDAVDCDRRPWRVARRLAFPAGPEEAVGDDSLWAALPTLRPWRETVSLDLVCVDARPSRLDVSPDDVALFSTESSACYETKSVLERPYVFRRAFPLADLHMMDDATDDDDDNDEPPPRRPSHPAWRHPEHLAFRNRSNLLRRDAQAWLRRRQAAARRREPHASLIVAVTTDGKKKSESGASVYVLDEFLGSWVLVGVAPRAFKGWGVSACAFASSIVVASLIDNAIALSLDDLGWYPVEAPPPQRVDRPFAPQRHGGLDSLLALPRLLLCRGPTDDAAAAAILISSSTTLAFDLRATDDGALRFRPAASAPTAAPLPPLEAKRDFPPPWTAVLLPLTL